MKLERYSEEADLLAREKIETTAALKIYRDKQEKQMQKQCEKREEIRRALRRTGADISFLRKERDRMTKRSTCYGKNYDSWMILKYEVRSF